LIFLFSGGVGLEAACPRMFYWGYRLALEGLRKILDLIEAALPPHPADDPGVGALAALDGPPGALIISLDYLLDIFLAYACGFPFPPLPEFF